MLDDTMNKMNNFFSKLNTNTEEQRKNALLREVVDNLQMAADTSLDYYNKILKKTEQLEIKYHEEKKKVKELSDYFSASEVLMSNEKNFEEQLRDALPLIIKGTRHDRIWVYKRGIDNLDLIAASVDEDDVRKLRIPPLPDIYQIKDFPLCETHTFQGKSVFLSKDIIPEESSLVLPQNILSISALPIFSNNKKEDVWGVIGLSNYTTTKLPNESERQILSSFSNIISLCLQNNLEC